MKIVVIGGNGQLGSDVVQAFIEKGDTVHSLSHADIEIADIGSVSACLKALAPDLVVNTAAMHHVEECERHPGKAYAINALGARNVAMVTQELDATLVHVSTDYVFDGSKSEAYVEEDVPFPLNVYGNSKMAGEFFVRSINSKHFVLRSSALYGRRPCRAKGGRNFVNLMLELAHKHKQIRVVDTEVVSPTSTFELARQIQLLCCSDAYGLYHATAEGACSWYTFAREIFTATRVSANLQIADPKEFPAKVARPNFSALENRGLKTVGLNCFNPWQYGLRQYLAQLAA